MPKISPARRSKLTPFSRSIPCSSFTFRSFTVSTTASGAAVPLSTSSKTLRPTINSASDSGLLSAVFTVSTMVPRRITETLSVASMISRSLCVIRMMVLP
ncbi:MAG: hypothetical protein ACD_54C00167G0001 [uncultured bacterium]|nr:MAG: hypothetical protein ACD_54C00167G0001 [uncultured bacterium]